MPDLSVFQKLKTMQDYQQAEEEFQLKKLLNSHAGKNTLPAALQIADEYAKARASGDVQRMNDIALAAKSFDKGIAYDQMGNPGAMQGYGDAVGSIAGTKKLYEANAQNASDLAYDPAIAGGEAAARQQQELTYASPIAQATASGRSTGEQIGNIGKRGVQSTDNIAVINEILTPDESGRTILDKATGSTVGAGYAAGKQFFGKSDESTQANAALTVYGGKLLNNVPRMEGPQSDADLRSYKEQAGKIADPRVPAGDKKAALSVISQLSEKYAAQAASISPAILNGQTLPFMNEADVLQKIDPIAAKAEAEFNAKKKNGWSYGGKVQ